MSPRRRVEQELTKDQILDAARRLFALMGFHGVSMRDIARELGYSHGSIYYHFKNKEDLFNELLEKDFDLLNGAMTEVVAKPHELKDILMAFVQFGFEHPHHYEMMFMSKEESFLDHPAPLASYMRFVEETGKFHVEVQDIYFLFISLHGFISYHLRSEPFYQQGVSLAETYVDFVIGRFK